MIKIILIIILIFIIINFINIQENYTPLLNKDFIKILKDDDYEIGDNYIKKCINDKCNEYKYYKSFNSKESIKIAKNKYKTNNILKNNNIKVPNSIIININDNISKINYPIVLKPINGTFGRDVYTNIENEKDYNIIIKKMREKGYNKILCEEMCYGDCYRIFIFNNNVIDIIKREKPYVIGNGINTIKELNDLRNDEQIKNKLYTLNELDNNYINKQGYNINNILEKDKKIYISNVINLHNGAIPSKIDINTIPKENIDMFIKVAKLLNLRSAGIDYLSNDIKENYKNGYNTNIILEVNGTPDIGIHLLFDHNFYEKIKTKI